MPLPRRPARRRATPLALTCCLTLLGGCGHHDSMTAGRAQMQQGHYAAAVIEFKNAVQDKPGSVDGRLALADALERINEPAAVEHHLRSALANGGDADVLVPRIAFLMLERNDVEKLTQEFSSRSLKAPAANGDLRAIVAMALVAQGRLPAAAERLEGLASTATVALARAQLLLAQGRRAEALAALQGSGTDASAPWWILRAVGRLDASYGKADAALAVIRRAHEAVPWNNALTGEVGEALMNAGRFDEAAVVRDALVKTAPHYYWTAYLDAGLQMRAGHGDEALAAASRVLAVVPEHLPATLIAASAEMQHGEVEMPLRRLSNIVGKYPTSLPALALLAQAQMRAGKLQDASATVHKGLLRAPDNLALLSRQADIDVLAGRRQQAADTLAAIAARDPKDLSTLLRLAELKGSLGDRQSAADLLDHVAAQAQGDALLLDRTVAAALRVQALPAALRIARQGVAAMPNDAQARLTLAAAQAAQQDSSAAWASALAALDLKPTYPPALSALGAMAADAGQRAVVAARYAKAVDASTTDSRTYLEYAARLRADGTAAGTAGDTPLAVLEKGMSVAPEAMALREALVQQYLRDGAPDKALSTAQSGVSIANAPTSAQVLMAATYERLGCNEQAADAWRKLAASFPQRVDWSLKVARYEIEAGRQPQAVSILRSLITNRPFDPAAYVQLARLEASTQTGEALSIAHQMAEHDTLRKDALLLEGDVLVLARRYDDALRQYDKALHAGATTAAQLRTAGLLDRMGRSPSAASLVADLLRDHPKDPEVLGFAAQRALVTGDAATGIALLARVVALAPANPVALNDLAWAQVQARRPEALATARKALALMPDHPKVIDTLGMALLASGDSAQAVATLRVATNLAPTADGPRLHLAQALAAAGDRQGASNVARSIMAGKLAAHDRATLDDIVASTRG